MPQQGGESLFLYVTVYDGQLTHKSEVWVDIMNTTGLHDPRRPAPPKIPSNMGPGFRAPPPPPNPNFRTPFHPLLQGFPSRPFPKLPLHNVQPPSSQPTSVVAQEVSSTSTTTSTEHTTKALDSSKPLSTEKPGKEDIEDTSAKNKVIAVTTTPVVDDNQAVIRNLALTIIPIVLVCATFLVSAISACVFRKKICKDKKKSKKGDKVSLFNLLNKILNKRKK